MVLVIGGKNGVVLGYSRFHDNCARSKAPRDVLVDNLDLRSIRHVAPCQCRNQTLY